jgi:hypothetical protein
MGFDRTGIVKLIPSLGCSIVLFIVLEGVFPLVRFREDAQKFFVIYIFSYYLVFIFG